MSCPFCPSFELDAQVVFHDDLVAFVQDERHQGALKHSGVIVPLRHMAPVFDLSESEIVATYRQEPVAGKGIRALLTSEANAW